MKLEDQYLKFVRWEEPDGLYVGYCPDLFLGGVCHGCDQTVVYAELCELVTGEIHDLAHEGRPLPPPHTRPMQELELAASEPFFPAMSADTLLQTALATHGGTTGTIHWLEPGTSVMKLAAHVGLPPQVAEIVAVVPIGKGMAGLAAERREPVQTCNLQQDTTGDIRPGAKAVPVQASIAVPMLVEGELRGVLGLAKAEAHEWTAAELAALLETASEMARQLA